MRLFSITVSATRVRNEQPEISMQNVIGLMVGEEDIGNTALEHAKSVYSLLDDWTDHRAVWTEIPQTLMFGPYRITWSGEDTRVTEGGQE